MRGIDNEIWGFQGRKFIGGEIVDPEPQSKVVLESGGRKIQKVDIYE